MAKRIRNRMELRDQFEAAERRKQEEDTDTDEEVEEVDEDADEEADESEEVEAAPVKKKKAPAKEAKPKRTRATKQVRMKMVWKVFNNSNQPVATFEYSKRKEAEEHAAKLQAAKNPPQPFFVQPSKEPMEEK